MKKNYLDCFLSLDIIDDVSVDKAENDKKPGTFTGVFSTATLDSHNSKILSEAFDESIAQIKKAGLPVQMLFMHDPYELPIGVFPADLLVKKNNRWVATGDLNLETQKGKEVYALLRQKALRALSIGGRVKLEDIEELKDGTEIIKKIELREISVVFSPANKDAVINVVNSDNKRNRFSLEAVKNIKSKAEFEKLLREAGCFSKSAATWLAGYFDVKQCETVDDQNEWAKKVIKLNANINKFLEIKNARSSN